MSRCSESIDRGGKGAAKGLFRHHRFGRSLQPTRGGHQQCNRLHQRLHKLLYGKQRTIQMHTVLLQQQVLGDPRFAEGETFTSRDREELKRVQRELKCNAVQGQLQEEVGAAPGTE